MKVKTAVLVGVALDWAIAQCENEPIKLNPMGFEREYSQSGYWIWDDTGGLSKARYYLIGDSYSPSRFWSQGGPFIERELITISPIWQDGKSSWEAYYEVAGEEETSYISGSTPLEAAMRCYVARKFGDEIEVPKQLLS